MHLATIDLERLERAEPEELARFGAACAGGAFFVRAGTACATDIDALLASARGFFALPQRERDAVDMMLSPYFRGYSRAGTERTQGRPDVREQFDVGPEEGPQTGDDPAWLRLYGPNLWPSAQPGLQRVISRWMTQMRAVSIQLVEALARTAALPESAFAGAFDGQPHERLKIIRYPATGAEPPQGVGEHSDSGVITLIADDGARGLQLANGDGTYADVVSEPGTLVVITGRALQHATSDAVLAPMHRVCAPPNAPERISIAYFLNPRLDFGGYGDEALAVLTRSHPHVAQRWFPDLVPSG